MRSPMGLRTKNPPPSLICRDFSMRSTPRATTILSRVSNSLWCTCRLLRLFFFSRVQYTCPTFVLFICQLSLTRDALRADNDLAIILRCHAYLSGRGHCGEITDITVNCLKCEHVMEEHLRGTRHFLLTITVFISSALSSPTSYIRYANCSYSA